MSWRRFLILCQNLSPHGAVAVRIRADEDKRDKDRYAMSEEERRAADSQDERAATAFFTSVISV